MEPPLRSTDDAVYSWCRPSSSATRVSRPENCAVCLAPAALAYKPCIRRGPECRDPLRRVLEREAGCAREPQIRAASGLRLGGERTRTAGRVPCIAASHAAGPCLCAGGPAPPPPSALPTRRARGRRLEADSRGKTVAFLRGRLTAEPKPGSGTCSPTARCWGTTVAKDLIVARTGRSSFRDRIIKKETPFAPGTEGHRAARIESR